MRPRLPTKLLDSIQDQLNTLGLGQITHVESRTGGCIAEALLITTQKIASDKDNRIFAKTHSNPPETLFVTEAQGLEALRRASALKIPQTLAATEQYLLLEYLPPAPVTDDSFWQRLAEGLAYMHQQAQPCFGFEADNYCGATRQPNPQCDDGFVFFGEHRLLFQAKLAHDSGLLSSGEVADVETLIAQLPELVPEQAPALLHGDLWSGNIHSCTTPGSGLAIPALIDPACYWGWREADIAMTRLFGGFPEAFYQHYQPLLPMEPGWQQRMDIYNLYHLLNHLNLFGGSYRQQAMSIVRRFT